MLFRVRYGENMATRRTAWRGREGFAQNAEDIAYFRDNPERLTSEVPA